MKPGTLLALSLGVILAFGQGLLAKGGRGQGGQGRQNGNDSVRSQNSNDNNRHGSADRDFGKDRAAEVGRGKKKGLHKDQYSIGEGREKRRGDYDKKDKDKAKDLNKKKDQD